MATCLFVNCITNTLKSATKNVIRVRPLFDYSQQWQHLSHKIIGVSYLAVDTMAAYVNPSDLHYLYIYDLYIDLISIYILYLSYISIRSRLFVLCMITCHLFIQGVLDNQFFLEHWDCEKLTGTKTLKHYAKILLQSTLSHPIVHPVCLNLTIRMLDHGAKVFVKYWKNVVMGM